MTETEHDIRRVARKWAKLTACAAGEMREELLRGSPAPAEPWLPAAREMFASLGLSHNGVSAERLADLLSQQWVFEAVHHRPSREHGFALRNALALPEASRAFSSNTALAFHRAVEAAPLDAWQVYHEQFLAEYSPALRKQSGAYFTPAAAIGYLVRSVDDLLRRQFGLPHGLGELFAPEKTSKKVSPRRERQLVVVDPACGVGGFLLGVMQWARAKGYGGNASPGVLLGFETAPETCLAARSLLPGDDDHRVLCLDPLACPPENLPVLGDWLGASYNHSREHAHRPPSVLIVFANPPYSNFGSHAGGRWMRQELDEYKRGLREKKINLDDDYIRFLRWGQICVDRVGAGILAYVTSNTFLTGITHRRLRESLLESFDELYVFNLHGGVKHRRQTGGAVDENIFSIQQGVALHLFVKRPANPSPKRRLGCLHLAEIRGERTKKIHALSETSLKTTAWREQTPTPDDFLFRADQRTPSPEYQQGVPLNEVFGEYVSGVQTKNDGVFVGRTCEEVQEKVTAFLAQQKESGEFSPDRLRRYLTAPFDQRWVYYDPTLLGRARLQVMRHMLPGNLGLVFMRQDANDGEYDHFLAVDALVSDRIFYSAHGAAFLAPLYLQGAEPILRDGPPSRTNFNRDWLQEFAGRLRLNLLMVGRGDLMANFGPEDVFAFMYASFHSKTYRASNVDLLRRAFPRVVWPSSVAQFQRLSQLGRRLVTLHCFQGPVSSISVLRGAGNANIARGFPKLEPSGNRQAGKIAINPTQAFSDVSPADWQWRVGGYPVLRHWLKTRRRAALNSEEITNFQRLVGICRSSRQLAQQIERALSGE